MKRIYKLAVYTLVTVFIVPGIFAQQKEHPVNSEKKRSFSQPRNVILYIGDGFGLAPKTAARMALGQGRDGQRFSNQFGFYTMAIDKLRYQTTVTTHSLNSWITDSAPGASVYACGEDGKIDNEVIALNPATGEPIETILEKAKKEGYAVGLVTTTRITHATPAAFATHIWYRDLEDYLAAQYLSANESEYEGIFNSSPNADYYYNEARDWKLPDPKAGVEVDVLLGGGARHFLPGNIESEYGKVKDASGSSVMDSSGTEVVLGGRRADDVDLIAMAINRGYTYVNSRDALLKLNVDSFKPGNNKKLLGLFHSSHMNYEQDRQMFASWEPSLSEMTEMAIKVLKAKGGKKGFFLMVEAGRIDHLEHANTGGIEVVSDGTTNRYTISADKETYGPNGEGNYSATPTTERTPNVYGSDYMIKEVMAFDYAIAEGRKLLDYSNNRTLILSTSDHECGGFTLVGLHDANDRQGNGTMIRTYAAEITKSTPGANPNDGVISRGDGGENGWYPEYIMTDFQGKQYPVPASASAKRIVVAYGSNPVTNGNGGISGSTPGNHTPQDIWVGADDNTGTHARDISGRGLLDNTDLYPIMIDFLSLHNWYQKNADTEESKADTAKVESTIQQDNAETLLNDAETLNVYPVPATYEVNIEYNSPEQGDGKLDVYNTKGKLVESLKIDIAKGPNSLKYNTQNLSPGVYFIHMQKGDKLNIAKFVK